MNDHRSEISTDTPGLLPVTFRSPNTNTGSGALVYIVLVPFLTVALYAFIRGLLYAILQPLEFDELLLGQVMAAILLPLAFIVVTWFAFTDYRRRAGARIDVVNDCVVVASAFYEQRFENTDIANVRIVPERSKDACRLELKDGRRIHLLSEVATQEQLRPTFEVCLIPELAGCLDASLRNGVTIDLSENKVRAAFRVFAGIVGLSLGLLFLYLVPLLPWMPSVNTSLRRIRRGWRGLTGGFSLAFDCLTPTKLWGGLPIDRSSVVDVVIDDIGVVVHFENELQVKASLFAENYWMVSHWLADHHQS